MKNVEIELRYEIVKHQELETFINTLTKIGTRRIVDVYLDTPTIDLLKKGVYVRIRDNRKIDIKFNRACLHDPALELQPYCEEYTYMLPLHDFDLDNFNSIVKTVGLKPIMTPNFDLFKVINKLRYHRIVDKIRTTYSIDNFTIALDDVADLGYFLEIELMTNSTEDIDAIKAKMEELLRPLTLKPLKTGYDSLILRKQNFKEYLQGRFILDEDKVMRRDYFAQRIKESCE